MRCGHPVVDEIPDDNPFKQTICNLVTGEEMSYEEIWEKLEEASDPIDQADDVDIDPDEVRDV